MADALITPQTGLAMWLVSGGLIFYSAKKVREKADIGNIPLMGVLGAFIFAAQMINFTIPGTGSSGHLGGGMILSILLGPHAAFLVLASVLTIQALFFADGGLLALGCNIFNMGFFTCYVAYPLIYKVIAGSRPDKKRLFFSSILSCIIGLQLGSAGVVLETVSSGISELPFKTFILLMLPIHLVIGLVEGFITSGVVSFVMSARPEILSAASDREPLTVNVKRVIIGIASAAIITGVVLSWFASAKPDGLEWSVSKTSGGKDLQQNGRVHGLFAAMQEKSSFFPDYDFKKSEAGVLKKDSWPALEPGTSASGFAGGFLTLLLVVLIGLGLKRRKSIY